MKCENILCYSQCGSTHHPINRTRYDFGPINFPVVEYVVINVFRAAVRRLFVTDERCADRDGIGFNCIIRKNGSPDDHVRSIL